MLSSINRVRFILCNPYDVPVWVSLAVPHLRLTVLTITCGGETGTLLYNHPPYFRGLSSLSGYTPLTIYRGIGPYTPILARREVTCFEH